MAVDAKKPAVVVIEHERATECSITLHKEETELVEHKYLGSWIRAGGRYQ